MMIATNSSSAARPPSTMVWQKEVQQPLSPAQPAHYRVALDDSRLASGMQGHDTSELAGIHVAAANPAVTANRPFPTSLHERGSFGSPLPTGPSPGAPATLEPNYCFPDFPAEGNAFPSYGQQLQQDTRAASASAAPLAPRPGTVTPVAPSSNRVPAGYEYINWYTGTPHDPRYMDDEGIYYFPPERVLLPADLLRVGSSSHGGRSYLSASSQRVLSPPLSHFYPGDYPCSDMVPESLPDDATNLPGVKGGHSELQHQADLQAAVLSQTQRPVSPSAPMSFYQGSEELFSVSQALNTLSASSNSGSANIFQSGTQGGCRGYGRRPTSRKRSRRLCCWIAA